MADAFSAVAFGFRECSRLIASVPHLWTDEAEYRRLAAGVADSAAAARAAYGAVDVRLRRAGGPNPMYEALNDVLTVQVWAPLNPAELTGGLNGILTRLHTKRSALFRRAEGKDIIDRILDQLARAPQVRPSGVRGDDAGVPQAAKFIPLTSWTDILAALNEPHGRAVWKSNENTRDKIRKLNTKHDGPIKFNQGKGKQPSVDKTALIRWWNSLEDQYDARVEEEHQRADSARLTVADSHNFGADAKVVPGIGGSEKRSRAKGNQKGKERKK